VQISQRDGGYIEARFTVGLPARGRNIEGRWCAKILTETVPKLVQGSLLWTSLDVPQTIAHVLSVEDQECLRKMLLPRGLVAFVANGAILPRATGSTDVPLSGGIPFVSPPQCIGSFELPNKGKVEGMCIKKGVNVIIGGGFHGKSTLLSALEVGIYNHVLGDGRELVVCDPTALKIVSEDGRAVTKLDISPFINNLPFGKNTTDFTTTNASGSTSQASNIIEAIELGSTLLLLDEDTCATNFMSRDLLMSQVVSSKQEPITCFLERVRELYDCHGISSILVVGGCGAYFGVADFVLMMESYCASDVTASCISAYSSMFGTPPSSIKATASHFDTAVLSRRAVDETSCLVPGADGGKTFVKIYDKKEILYGSEAEKIDLSSVAQLIEVGQTRCIAEVLQFVAYEATSSRRGDNRTQRRSLRCSHQTHVIIVIFNSY